MPGVRRSIERGVARLALSRPPHNSISGALLRELRAALQSCCRDEAVRAIVLSGEGPDFSLGIDVGELADVPSAEEGERLSQEAQKLTRALLACPLPVIAAMHGRCLGAGAELALACHLRFAAEDLRFGQPEIKLSVIPGMGGTQLLPRVVGSGAALELLLSGDPVDSAHALRIGLVQRVMPAEALLPFCLGLGRRLARHSKPAVAGMLEAVQQGLQLSLADGLQLEARIFGQRMASEDHQEACRAFLERRPPELKDR